MYSNGNTFWATVETYVVIFLYKICASSNLFLKINVLNAKTSNETLVEIELKDILYENATEKQIYCNCPIVITDNSVIAGLCSVARQLVKCSKLEEVIKLLGFREASLMACSETSIWTRFCEIDIINTVKTILKENNYGKFVIPTNLARFEYHLQLPVRIHNVYKVAREKNSNKDLKSGLPINQLNLEHTFGEGPFMTLADVLLYPCYKIIFNIIPLEKHLPTTSNWFNRMKSLSFPEINVNLKQIEFEEIVFPDSFTKQSLYQADPSRYKPEKRIFTKQNDIEYSLNLINSLDEYIDNEFLPFGHEIPFNWTDIPVEANPTGGALPQKRANRKCEQLENLAKAVIKLTASKCLRIVDFCSGSGHLGILLACSLPNSHIILVENKERSLLRAKERIRKLNLQNVTIVQSNLDYFIGKFDIGVSLHACGVATDLVIQKCIENGAHFVCCPCCYGGIQNCHQLNYPRSKQFNELDLGENYFNLAHASDQTHDSDNCKTHQGYKCMDVIDTDRKLYAKSCGYKVFLGKLQPVTCTNKNNILVGVKI